MNIKTSILERMLILSIGFTMVLLLARIGYTKELTYGFYIWNTFLGIIPLLFSRQLLTLPVFRFKAFVLIAGWLLFFPNAPYIITDLFHYTVRPPMPAWFDLLLVTSAAWNGLLLGIVSLMHVEQFLSIYIKAIWVKMSLLISSLLCGYGIYIGRFLRFNSWDIVSDPLSIIRASGHHVLRPHEHLRTWGFTILFGTMFSIIYFTLRALGNTGSRVIQR